MQITKAKTQITGYIGNDPEFRVAANDMKVAKFRIGTHTRKWDAQNKVTKDHTNWFSVVAFDALAEQARDMIHKGARIEVQGRLQTTEWPDKETGQLRVTYEVIMDEWIPCSPAGDRKAEHEQANESQAAPQTGGEEAIASVF
ncbi:MAG TPA: single-stranded DNA-binding protein [Candidatus Binatia bacterium]|nr:single-stranded DNA-binding protein [Candidatus Binatia bacterium]